MANEFDNTDPLQLTTEPVQAAVPQPVQQPVQQPAPQQEPQAHPLEADFKLFDEYKRRGVSTGDMIGFMTQDGKRTREDVLGAMQAQYDIQQKEIRAENERMKKEQAAAERMMIERQEALNALVKKKESESARLSEPSVSASGGKAEELSESMVGDPQALELEGEIINGIDTYNVPAGFDNEELAPLYVESTTLADNGLAMQLTDKAMGFIKNNDKEGLALAMRALDNEDILDIYERYEEEEEGAAEELNKALFNEYNRAKEATVQNMNALSELSAEANIPWGYNSESDIDVNQAILEAFKIEEANQKKTKAYQDRLFAQRQGMLDLEEQNDRFGYWITNRSVGSAKFVNSVVYALPKQVKGIYFDQIGEDEKAKVMFRAAQLTDEYNAIQDKQRTEEYGLTEKDMEKGLWKTITDAWDDEDSWYNVGAKASMVMGDVLPDVLMAAASLGLGTIIKEGSKQAVKELAEYKGKQILGKYIGDTARRSAYTQLALGQGLQKSTLAFFGVRGAGGTYQSVWDDPTLSKNEKMFLSTTVGVAEAALGYMLRGAETSIAKGVMGISGKTLNKEAIKEAMKGVTKREILLRGMKESGSEWLEEAGIEAIQQGTRIIQDKVAGRKSKDIDWYAIMDAGLAGLLGAGPMTSLSSLSAARAHHKIEKNRSLIVKELERLDQAISLAKDPSVIEGLKKEREEMQSYLNQVEGMSEKEYSKLSDGDKKRVNTLHREMALTRQEIKREKDPAARAALEERFEALYEQKVAIEKAADGNPTVDPVPPVPDSEGDVTPVEPRDVSQEDREDMEKAPEEEADDDIDVPEEADARINAKVDSAVRALERVENDSENAGRHIRTAKGQRTRAINLLVEEGMSREQATKEIDRRIESRGKDRSEAAKKKAPKKSKAESRTAEPSRGSVAVDMSKPTDVKADWVGNGPGQIPVEVVAQIDRMKRAFGGILNKLGVKIQVHLSQDSFIEATGKDSIGAYDHKNKTIHIGPKAKRADVIEEFGHAAFRTILKSDKALSARLYASMATEAGLTLDRNGLVKLPDGFLERVKSEGKIPLTPEDIALIQLGRTNPFARALIGTEIDYADYSKDGRKEEAIMDALRGYALNPDAYNAASRRSGNVSRLDVLKAFVNRALKRAGYKGNFISGEEVDFFSFAQKFSLAAEGVETDITVDESDYTADPIPTPQKKKQKKQKQSKKRRVIKARPGESSQDAARRAKEEERQEAERSAIASFEQELGAPEGLSEDMFESRNKRFDFLVDEEVFYYEDRYAEYDGVLDERTRRRARLKSIKVKDYFHFRNFYNYMTSNGMRPGRVFGMYYMKDGVKKMLRQPKPRTDKDGNVVRIDGAMHPNVAEGFYRKKAYDAANERSRARSKVNQDIGAIIKDSRFNGLLFFHGFYPKIDGESAAHLRPEREISHADYMRAAELALENLETLIQSDATREDIRALRLGQDPSEFTRMAHQTMPDPSPGDVTGDGVMEARSGGYFDRLDEGAAARRGLPVGDISETNGSFMRTFGFDTTFAQRVEIAPQDDITSESVDVKSGVTELFGKRIEVDGEQRVVLSTHRDSKKALAELRTLREMAEQDRRSKNPKGYITIGFSVLKDKALLGNPSVFSYIVKKFSYDKALGEKKTISSVQSALDSLSEARLSSVMSVLGLASIKPGVNMSIQDAFAQAKPKVRTIEQARFVIDTLADVDTEASFEFRTDVAKSLGAVESDIATIFKDPLFAKADLGTVVAFVKVPYTYNKDTGISGFRATVVEGEAFAGAIILDREVEDVFEGHRLAREQYRIEDVLPEERVKREVRDDGKVKETLTPQMRRAAAAQARVDELRAQLSDDIMTKPERARKVEQLKKAQKESREIRAAVNKLAGISALPKGRVNLNMNYGNKSEDAKDVYMGSKGVVSKPIPLNQEGSTMESRSDRVSDSLFESRGQTDVNQDTPSTADFTLRPQTAFQQWKNKWIQRLQDKYKSVMMIQEDVESALGRTVDESQDFKMKEELMYGKAATDLAKLDKEVESLRDEMKKEGVTVGEVTDYLYARHARERNELIKERTEGKNESGSGMTTQEAQDVLDSIPQSKKDKLDRIAKKLDKIQEETRKIMVEFGLETQETIDQWNSMFEFYVPLAGLAVDEESSSTTPYPTGGAGLQVKGPMTKRAEGRKTRADNIVAQIIAQAAAVRVQARTNEALLAMKNLVENNPNERVWKIVEGDKYKGSENAVPIRVDGKQMYIFFPNAEYARTLKNMNIPKTNWLAKVLAPANNWLRRSFTTLNPEFVISNFSRDIQAALFNAAAESDIEGGQVLGKRVMADMAKRTGPALRALLNKQFGRGVDPLVDRYFEEFQEDGGQTGWGYQKELAEIASELEGSTADRADTVLGRVRRGQTRAQEILGSSLKRTSEVVEGVNDAFENSIRLSAYITARENGVSREKAAQFAKNITVNFNKSGEYGQIANQIFLFFNASVQGSARLIRSLVSLKPPKAPDGSSREWYQRINTAQKLAAGYTLFAGMLAMVGRALSDEDEDGVLYYDKIPDYVKERNLVMMFDGKNYIKIPMPYGFNLFANMGTSMVDVAAGAKDWDEASWFLANSFLSSFSPISFGQSKDIFTYSGKAITPTAFKPVVDIIANETYFGGPVYAEQSPYGAPKPNSSMSFRSPDMVKQFFSLMNEMTGGSVEAPGKVDINPDKFWHIFDYFLGGAGQFVTRTGETTFRVGQKVLVDDDIKVEFNDFPLLRKMYGEPSKYYDFEKFKEREDEIKQLAREYKDPSARKDDPERYRALGKLDKAINTINKRLKAIRKLKRQAKDIENYAERQIEIQRLMDLQRKEVMRFNKYYDEIRGED